MDKKALRKKRLDELEEEEGFLSSDTFHSPSSRGEEALFDEEEEESEDEEAPVLMDEVQRKRNKRDKRIDLIRNRHQEFLKKKHAPAAPAEETMFEPTIPDGGKTQAEELAEAFEGLPEEVVEETSETGELADQTENQGVRSDEVFDKELFLPVEEVRILAPAFAEDYGYTGDESYVAPASAGKRSEIKGILSRIYDFMIDQGKASERVKNKAAFEEGKKNELSNEMKEVDTLNDLEASHVLSYYKKIMMANKRMQKKLRKPEEEEGEE
jgi:hypothetical protein